MDKELKRSPHIPISHDEPQITITQPVVTRKQSKDLVRTKSQSESPRFLCEENHRVSQIPLNLRKSQEDELRRMMREQQMKQVQKK